MPGEHRRPQRETGLTDFFAVAPWWVVPLVLLVAVGVVFRLAAVYDWPWPTTKAIAIAVSILIAPTGIGGLVKKVEHRRLLASARQLDDLRALTPRAFEELVLAAYRRRGYSGSLTASGADGGVDVILNRDGETVYVQCKRWTWQTIPVEAVRALKGSMATQNIARGIFVCCGRFTPEAERYAASSGITTVGGEALLDLIRDVTGAVPSAPTAAARATRPAATTAAPTCPRCQVAMVRRTGRHGEFWGCAGFPGCRATRPLETSGR